MECDSLYHLSKNHSSLTSSSDISSLHISAATETSIRLNLHRLGSTFKSVDEIEHTLNDLEKWKDSVPQVEVYKRFLQLRHRYILQKINYLENDYPRLKQQVQEYAALEKEKTRKHREQFIASHQRQMALVKDGKEQMVKPIAEDFHDMSRPVWTRRWSAWIEPSWKQKSSMSPSMTTTRHPDEVEERRCYRRRRPWPCRWPSPQPLSGNCEKEGLSQSDSSYLHEGSPSTSAGSDRLNNLPLNQSQGSSFDGQMGTSVSGMTCELSPKQATKSQLASSGVIVESCNSPQSDHTKRRTMPVVDIDTNPIQNRSSGFLKVRKNPYGRSPSIAITLTTDLSAKNSHCEEEEEGEYQTRKKNDQRAQNRKAEADSSHFREAILSEVETDLEVVSDHGVDTETDVEGRPATRCLLFDPFDGLPHPFWGVEVEQSSWVSIPNPSKLDPECKVLQMLRLLKPETYPKYNSTLLVRHYKPFLKYGMFPDALFELWGRGPQKNDFLKAEAEEREKLHRMKKYPSSDLYNSSNGAPCTSKEATAAVVLSDASQPCPQQAGKKEHEQDYVRSRIFYDVTFPEFHHYFYIGTCGSELDVKWIREQAHRFQKKTTRHQARLSSISAESVHPHRTKCGEDVDEMKISCPIDPTWRNVYSSRVRILKRFSKRKIEEVIATVDSELGGSPDRLKMPSSRVSRMRGSKSYEEFHHLYGMRRTSSDGKPVSAQHPLADIELVRTKSRVGKRVRSIASLGALAVNRVRETEARRHHKAHKTLRLKRVTSLPDSHRMLEIEIARQELWKERSRLGVEGKKCCYVRNDQIKEEQMELVNEEGQCGTQKICNETEEVVTSDSDTHLLKHSISFGKGFPAFITVDESTPLPLHRSDHDVQRLQLIALKKRMQNRPKLKARKGRRVISHHEGVLTEGQAWLRFHQIRDVRTLEDWPGVPPTPVPAPSSISVPSMSHRGCATSAASAPSVPWPTFIPTIFRGPAQCEDLQEAFLYILWSMRNSKKHLPLPKTKKLKVWIGGYMIPHDEKRFRCGDDSWFGSEPLMAFGVCDGVGEMSDTQWRVAGFDCRGFGEDILREAKARFQTIRTATQPLSCTRPRMILPQGCQRSDKQWRNVEFEVCSHTEPPSLMALESLIAGFYGKTTTWGAATCLIGCLNEDGNKIGFANIGDSKAMVLRRGLFSTGPLHIVGTTIPEQHGWNLPVQLARLPDRSRIRTMRDDPRLSNLVKTLDSCRATGQDINDPAETATLFDFDVQEGDLIIIGTDGLWDNLFDEEVAALCGVALSPLESEWMTGSVFMSTAPRGIAKGLCLAAYWRSIQFSCETPFTCSVREAGGISYGGKPDDITVMAAWIVPSRDENTVALLQRCQRERDAQRIRTSPSLTAISNEESP